MKTTMTNSILILLLASLVSQGCSKKSSSLAVKSLIKQKENMTSSLRDVQIHNDQITVRGGGFAKVKSLKLKGNGLDVEFRVDSASETQVVASALSDFHIPLDSVFNLIIGTVDAQSTYPVSVLLDDHSVDLSKLKVSNGANGFVTGSILKFDGTNWVAGTLPNSQVYMGTWNAGSNSPDLSDGQFQNGDYFIVTTAGTHNSVSYQVGDWVMFDGTNWDKISNSANVVSSFQGRRGVVTLAPADYSSLLNASEKIPNSSLNHLSDVDLTTVAPTNGKVLKYNGTKWVAADDGGGAGGANSVGTSELQDSSVTAAKLNLADGSIAQSKVANLASDLAGKEPAIAAGTAAQFYRGDKSWATLNSAAVAESTNLYFTNARVLGVPLAGFSSSTGTVSDADSVLTAIGKLSGNVTSLSGSFIDWSTSGLQTIDPSRLNLGFSSSVVVTDATGKIGTSTVTSSELLHLSGVTSAIQVQLDAKQGTVSKTTVLPVSKTRVYGSNGTNYVELSAATLTANRSLVFPDSNGTSGQYLSTDGAGNLSWSSPAGGVTSVNSQTGAVTLTTANIAEGSNLYFTNARALGVPLSGFTTATGAVVATDSILAAIGKLQGQLNLKADSSAITDWSTTGVQTIDPSRLNLTTANRVLVTNGSANPSASSVTSTELGYLSGATANIQTQLNTKLSAETDPNVSAFAKAALPTCAAGEVLKSNGTAFSCVTDNTGAGAYTGTLNRLVMTDGTTGALTTSSVTSTEAGYLSGVTSNLQTQLNAKQASIDKGTTLPVSKSRVYGANSSYYVEFSAATLTANRLLSFPDSNGTSGQYLSTDGAGNLSWSSPAGGVTSVNSQTGAVTLTTSNVSEGTNQYYTNARAIASTISAPTLTNSAIATNDTIQTALGKLQAQFNNVLSVVLTGLSTATNSAITAADSILVAMGKLQAQISAQATSVAGKADLTNMTQTITAATVTGLSSPVAGSDAANKTYVDTNTVANAGGASSVQIGTLAARPAAAAGNTGRMYVANDSGNEAVYVSTGSAWVKVASNGVSGTVDSTTAAASTIVQRGTAGEVYGQYLVPKTAVTENTTCTTDIGTIARDASGNLLTCQ